MLKTLNNGMEALLKLFAENRNIVLYEINKYNKIKSVLEFKLFAMIWNNNKNNELLYNNFFPYLIKDTWSW